MLNNILLSYELSLFMSHVQCSPPYPLDLFLKYKPVNRNLPNELTAFVDKNKNYVPTVWRKPAEPKIKTSWLVNSKLNQTSNDKVYASIKEVLNKLSKDNFEKLVADILNINITTKEQLEELSNIIFIKAVGEQIYSNLYAKLCYNLLNCCVKLEITNTNNEPQTKKYYFREYLLNKCQKMFLHYISLPASDEINTSKASATGCMKFIGELYNAQVITDKILISCLEALYKKIPTKCLYNIDSICVLLSASYKMYALADNKNATDYINKIQTVIQNKIQVNKRELFMLMDLLEKIKKE